MPTIRKAMILEEAKRIWGYEPTFHEAPTGDRERTAAIFLNGGAFLSGRRPSRNGARRVLYDLLRELERSPEAILQDAISKTKKLSAARAARAKIAGYEPQSILLREREEA